MKNTENKIACENLQNKQISYIYHHEEIFKT